MKAINIIYTVRGTGPFPIDMLRYDGSSPYSQQDSRRIEKLLNDIFTPHRASFEITLIKYGARQYNHAVEHNWTPNAAKWKSFGWEVISVEEKGI